ncbi:MAG: hypothetical protein ACLQUZ_16010 [Rhizomicrobium sp.]
MASPEPTVPSETEAAPADTREQTLRLLRAVSAEMSDLSQDIVRLGEALSGEILAIKQTGRLHDLQSFDLIAQSAQSHAQLLHKLIDTMSHAEGCSPSGLESLIETIPFHRVRGRLNAALKGQAGEVEKADAPGDDADWF